jgi:hypothetical protein
MDLHHSAGTTRVVPEKANAYSQTGIRLALVRYRTIRHRSLAK